MPVLLNSEVVVSNGVAGGVTSKDGGIVKVGNNQAKVFEYKEVEVVAGMFPGFTMARRK